MSLLVIICSTNPRWGLMRCIRRILKHYPTADILVVDSNSIDCSGFVEAENAFEDKISICYDGNLNWEFGAWNLGYNLHPNYDLYMCVQDTLFARSPLDIFNIDKNEIYLHTYGLRRRLYNFTNHPCKRFVGSSREVMYKTLTNSKYELKIRKLIDEGKDVEFMSHPSSLSFIATTNANLKNILDMLPTLPTTKYESIAFETTIGLVCKFEGYSILPIGEAFRKHFGNRWDNTEIQM